MATREATRQAAKACISAPDFELWLVNAHRAVNLPAPTDVAFEVGYRTLRHMTREELTAALAAMVEAGRKLEYGESLATVLLRAHKFLHEGGTSPLGPCSQGCHTGAFYLLSPAGVAGVALCAHCHPQDKAARSRAEIDAAVAAGWRLLAPREYEWARLHGAQYAEHMAACAQRYGRQ